MARVQLGGDPENFMDAPALSQGDGDGPGLIASALDLLGIHRMAAKGPKPAKGKKGDSNDLVQPEMGAGAPKGAPGSRLNDDTPPLLPTLDQMPLVVNPKPDRTLSIREIDPNDALDPNWNPVESQMPKDSGEKQVLGAIFKKVLGLG